MGLFDKLKSIVSKKEEIKDTTEEKIIETYDKGLEKTRKELDMGSYFDYFGDISSPLYTKGLTNHQINNRKTLRNLMLDNGFIPLESEWWHYTLKNEPYPDTYFNVEVKSDGN